MLRLLPGTGQAQLFASAVIARVTAAEAAKIERMAVTAFMGFLPRPVRMTVRSDSKTVVGAPRSGFLLPSMLVERVKITREKHPAMHSIWFRDDARASHA